MLLIVEGPDGGGKTSLAERFSRALVSESQSVGMIHAGPPRMHPLDEYAAPLYRYRPGQGANLVIDRWHVGELVYPQVLKRPTQLIEPVLRYIELVLLSRGAVLVHMSQPVEVLQSRVCGRGDDLVRVDQLAEIRKRFHNVFHHTISMPKWQLTGAVSDTDLAVIMNDGWVKDGHAELLNDFVTYIGTPQPNILLFGDVRGPRNQDPEAPAFVPYSGTSGHFLMQSLVAACNDLGGMRARNVFRRIGIANACDVDDPRKLYETLGEPERVLALGANAHLKLTELGIPHVFVPHPQWMRRFAHAQSLSYGQYLLGYSKEQSWR